MGRRNLNKEAGRLTIVETVKRICMEEAKRLVGAEVVAPLAVWDNANGSMGVQIKAPKQMGPQACEVIGGFTLASAELKQANAIRLKAACAVSCMLHDVQVQIRPLQKLKDVAPEAMLGKRHAD
jgi:hypothetical protein